MKGCLTIVVLFVLLAAGCSVLTNSDSGNSCEDLRAWYAENPYDSNPDIERDYVLKGC